MKLLRANLLVPTTLLAIVAYLSAPAMAGAQMNIPLIIQESRAPGTTGVPRSQDPVTVGIPLPDSAAIRDATQLGLAGTSAGQFRVLGRWPSGNAKWILVDTLADVTAGGQDTRI